jgi:hypothetical protein
MAIEKKSTHPVPGHSKDALAMHNGRQIIAGQIFGGPRLFGFRRNGVIHPPRHPLPKTQWLHCCWYK